MYSQFLYSRIRIPEYVLHNTYSYSAHQTGPKGKYGQVLTTEYNRGILFFCFTFLQSQLRCQPLALPSQLRHHPQALRRGYCRGDAKNHRNFQGVRRNCDVHLKHCDGVAVDATPTTVAIATSDTGIVVGLMSQ